MVNQKLCGLFVFEFVLRLIIELASLLPMPGFVSSLIMCLHSPLFAGSYELERGLASSSKGTWCPTEPVFLLGVVIMNLSSVFRPVLIVSEALFFCSPEVEYTILENLHPPKNRRYISRFFLVGTPYNIKPVITRNGICNWFLGFVVSLVSNYNWCTVSCSKYQVYTKKFIEVWVLE